MWGWEPRTLHNSTITRQLNWDTVKSQTLLRQTETGMGPPEKAPTTPL